MLSVLSEGILPKQSPKNPLASWDGAAQQRYRQTQELPYIHFLLDMSGSMERYAGALLAGYQGVHRLLKRLVSPLAVVDCWGFHNTSQQLLSGPLGTLPPLTTDTYQPDGGTRLYWALRSLLLVHRDPASMQYSAQHILVLFTDGLDTDDPPFTEIQETAQRLTEAQAAGWLCVYLGAFADALPQGLACGFTPGNCLVFDAYAMAEAFARLEAGLQRYLAAGKAEQKLLAQHGLFPVGA